MVPDIWWPEMILKKKIKKGGTQNMLPKMISRDMVVYFDIQKYSAQKYDAQKDIQKHGTHKYGALN